MCCLPQTENKQMGHDDWFPLEQFFFSIPSPSAHCMATSPVIRWGLLMLLTTVVCWAIEFLCFYTHNITEKS